MPVLRMRDACFTASGPPVGPITIDVCAGRRAALVFGSAREAAVAALLAAGIVKAGTGSVLIEEYDPRVQAAHCKRISAFVPHAPLSIAESEFQRYVRYRAALWNVDTDTAIGRAKYALERLEGVHEAFAYPIAAALVSDPSLLVLDRPPAEYARRILDAAGSRAVFSTHLQLTAADAF